LVCVHLHFVDGLFQDDHAPQWLEERKKKEEEGGGGEEAKEENEGEQEEEEDLIKLYICGFTLKCIKKYSDQKGKHGGRMETQSGRMRSKSAFLVYPRVCVCVGGGGIAFAAKCTQHEQ